METFNALLAYLHFAAIMLLAALATAEFFMLRENLNAKAVVALCRVDMLYVGAGFLALLSGAVRFGTTSREFIYIGGNPLFWVKMALFCVIALTSLYMSWRYSRWAHFARTDSSYHAPSSEAGSAQLLVKLQLVLIAILPLFAVLMVRGIAR